MATIVTQEPQQRSIVDNLIPLTQLSLQAQGQALRAKQIEAELAERKMFGPIRQQIFEAQLQNAALEGRMKEIDLENAPLAFEEQLASSRARTEATRSSTRRADQRFVGEQRILDAQGDIAEAEAKTAEARLKAQNDLATSRVEILGEQLRQLKDSEAARTFEQAVGLLQTSIRTGNTSILKAAGGLFGDDRIRGIIENLPDNATPGQRGALFDQIILGLFNDPNMSEADKELLKEAMIVRETAGVQGFADPNPADVATFRELAGEDAEIPRNELSGRLSDFFERRRAQSSGGAGSRDNPLPIPLDENGKVKRDEIKSGLYYRAPSGEVIKAK